MLLDLHWFSAAQLCAYSTEQAFFFNNRGQWSDTFSFNDQFGAFIDTYNYLNSEEGNQYMLETGLFWQVSRRVQLDIESDFDVQNFGKYYAVGCGVSWMIN